ncbi:MAG: HPr kinase/phosphatase C-terminal domain-containing protein [Geminicoccaceae bacterium]|nr:HPr kinase/phosphatase C-terminal domain-containing protein [Geminicoccaceae bacterium]
MPPEGRHIEARPGKGAAGTPTLRLHASCVALGGRGILLRGRPGSGKSDLALRLIDAGGSLVADDQVLIERHRQTLLARAPATLQGLIEVRGIGILRLDASEARLALVVDLDPVAERLPDPTVCRLLDVPLPAIRLDPRAPSAAAIVRVALDAERVA